LAVAGIIWGSLYALVGVSWGLIYSTTRTFHFAHGLTFTLAAYVVIIFHVWFHFPLLLSFGLGLLLAVLCGCAIELLIYRPVRRRSSGQLSIFLSAMGTMVLGESLLQIFFTPTPRSLQIPDLSDIPFSYGTIFFTLADLLLVVVAWGTICVLELYLSKSKIGREIRAVRSNPELATSVGISSEKTFLITFAIGSVLMGLGSFFVTIQSAATPHMGLNYVLMAFIATFLGGVGKDWGIALAGITIGLVENLPLVILPAQYKYIVVFALMFAFLLVKPEGFLGATNRVKR
jgi:branched-chain amino acid transport system permease protein